MQRTDLEKMEKLVTFLLLMENQFNKLDSFNPSYGISNTLLAHLYYMLAYMIDTGLKSEKASLRATFNQEYQTALKERRERKDILQEQEEGNGRPNSYARIRTASRISQITQSASRKSSQAAKSLQKSGSKTASRLAGGRSVVPKTKQSVLLPTELKIGSIQNARKILNEHLTNYDVNDLSLEILKVPSRFYYLSRALKLDAAHRTAEKANIFLAEFEEPLRFQVKDYAAGSKEATFSTTLRRLKTKDLKPHIDPVLTVLDHLIECHNEVIMTEYPRQEPDAIKDSDVDLTNYVRGLTRNRSKIFPLNELGASIHDNQYSAYEKLVETGKKENDWPPVTKMLFSKNNESLETFWTQCLVLFKRKSQTWQHEPFNVYKDAVYNLDNSLHELAWDGSVKKITDVLLPKLFKTKKNKDWKIRYINRPGNNKNTALHYALRAGRVDNAVELLKQGADWYVFNDEQESPYDVADAETMNELNNKIPKKQWYNEKKSSKLKKTIGLKNK